MYAIIVHLIFLLVILGKFQELIITHFIYFLKAQNIMREDLELFFVFHFLNNLFKQYSMKINRIYILYARIL